MKLLVAVPTLSRADLLNRFYADADKWVLGEDHLIILDNGTNQDISLPQSPNISVVRSPQNLGVSKSWNVFLDAAFVSGRYDGLLILQDDIGWDLQRMEVAKSLLREENDVDLFLSYSRFSVQLHRPGNVENIGFYDEIFTPAWCEDDDYALAMIRKGRIYQRYSQLDPVDGSMVEGTEKPNRWSENNAKLRQKWGVKLNFGVNYSERPYFKSNRFIGTVVSTKEFFKSIGVDDVWA